MFRLIIACIVTSTVLLLPRLSSADTKSTTKSTGDGSSASAPPHYTTEQLVAKFAPSVVKITALGSDGNILVDGCGIVYYDNVILTSLHVVNGAGAVKVTFASGKSEDASDVKSWRTGTDIVALDADTTGVKSLDPFAAGDEDNIGTSVVALGSPDAPQGSVIEGIISGIHNLSPILPVDVISTPIAPQSCGGALFDHHGKFLGMLSTAKLADQTINITYLSVDLSTIAAMPPSLTFDALKGHWGLITGDSPAPNTSADNLHSIFANLPEVDKTCYKCGLVYVYVDQQQGTDSLTNSDIVEHVKTRLKNANVPLATDDDYKNNPKAVFLDVAIVASKGDDSKWSARADTSLGEDVIIMRDKPVRATVGTWTTDDAETADSLSAAVYAAIDPTIDDFINGYTKQPSKD